MYFLPSFFFVYSSWPLTGYKRLNTELIVFSGPLVLFFGFGFHDDARLPFEETSSRYLVFIRTRFVAPYLGIGSSGAVSPNGRCGRRDRRVVGLK